MDLSGYFDTMESLFHINVSGTAAVYASSSVCHRYYGYVRLPHFIFAFYVPNEVKQPGEREGYQLAVQLHVFL